MKLVKKSQDGSATTLKTAAKKEDIAEQSSLPPWKVLIVDDEADVHTMTELGLKGFEFAGRGLQILRAMSAEKAKEILIAEPNIAVALVDVVMETDDAGLRLINFIRNELKYTLIRLVIRTGQPGMAPEKHVIESYDIDDYKSKTELRADKLYLMMRVTLKSYNDLLKLDNNRKALRRILEAVPKFHHAQSLSQFFNGILSQLIDLCNLGENSLICGVNSGLVIMADKQHTQAVIQSGTGRFSPGEQTEDVNYIQQVCTNYILDKNTDARLPNDSLLMPLKINEKPVGFVYLENAQHLNQADLNLIQIMVQQCSSALENLQLYMDLKEANEKVLNMLELAEQARQEAEQARQTAEEANRTKSQFLANMSHELRTPLNAIIGYSEMLEDSACDLSEQECLGDLHKIKTSGYHLLTMVDEVLDFSKIETGDMQVNPDTFPLKALLDEVIMTMQPIIEQAYNHFEVDLPAETGTLRTDRLKLHRILLTLLSNANKFTKQGLIRLTVITTDSQVQFKIIDEGIGMSPQQLANLFKPFTQGDSSSTRRYGGVGLGLTIAYHLGQLLGGELTATSELEKGSTFTFLLPRQHD